VRCLPTRLHAAGFRGACAVFRAMPGKQPMPKFIVASGPTSSLTPLYQRLGPGKRTRFVAQHVEVVLQIQHVLASTPSHHPTRQKSATSDKTVDGPALWSRKYCGLSCTPPRNGRRKAGLQRPNRMVADLVVQHRRGGC
jgi:hypothetical protein